MSGGGADVPSRFELLSMVKKHLDMMGKTIIDEPDVSNAEMDSKFWHDVFDLYFVQGKESRGRQDDDIVFLVRKMALQGCRDNTDGISPFFVRRWASKMDNLLGGILDEVDWRRSFYLNLIAHTSYTVTVAICSHQDIHNHQEGHTSTLSPIYKVIKTVYASPSRIAFHLDAEKEVETSPAYPDICFAINDFDSTFDPVILSSTDHCYCVLLNAHDGAAFPSVKEASDGSSSKIPLEIETIPGNSSKITLFSGFASYQMVHKAYNAGKSQFGSLLSIGHSPGKTDRLYMIGPGGRGEVEVAVSGVVDQSHYEAGPFSPVSFGIGSFFRKAATVATAAAKYAYTTASAATYLDDEMIPLKCCIMSVSLPWEHIAYDLLFKGNPPMNL
ncbi:hypothetical protein SAY86_000105 [Trapa natans]|uniref:Uncharacterized protein n=1 Tax=Trapa natans TaxID=22666 RepID=A0AAN7RFG1_TRANT|nr:hypothetical protein SAY86_000105 [Trapa natans]